MFAFVERAVLHDWLINWAVVEYSGNVMSEDVQRADAIAMHENNAADRCQLEHEHISRLVSKLCRIHSLEIQSSLNICW